MAELTYPKFPLRPLAAIGVVTVALGVGAILVNRSEPSISACATAAGRFMARHDFSLNQMRAAGSGPVPACHGLSAEQFGQALLDGYANEYGPSLPRAPIPRDVPPSNYKATSARSLLRQADTPGHPGGLGRLNHTGRLNHADRPGHTDRLNHADRPGHTGGGPAHTDRLKHADRPGHTGRLNHADRPGHTGPPDRLNHTGHTGLRGRHRAARPGQAVEP